MTDGGKPQLSQTLGKLPGEDKTDVGSLDIFKRIRLFFVFISFIFYLFIFMTEGKIFWTYCVLLL